MDPKRLSESPQSMPDFWKTFSLKGIHLLQMLLHESQFLMGLFIQTFNVCCWFSLIPFQFSLSLSFWISNWIEDSNECLAHAQGTSCFTALAGDALVSAFLYLAGCRIIALRCWLPFSLRLTVLALLILHRELRLCVHPGVMIFLSPLLSWCIFVSVLICRSNFGFQFCL